MGAILGGTMRSPLTGVVFALELTHDVNMLLPLLVAVTIAHGFTVLVLRRSILTEKIARRGYHLSREYAVDPLEILFVREVMRTSVAALPADAPYDTLRHSLHGDSVARPPAPVSGDRRRPASWSAWSRAATCRRWPMRRRDDAAAPLAAILKTRPDRRVSGRIAPHDRLSDGRNRADPLSGGRARKHGRLIGMIALTDLLKARALNLDAEQRRERVLALPRTFASSSVS